MKRSYIFAIIIIVTVIGWITISRTGQDTKRPSTGDAATPTGQKARPEKAPNFGLQDYGGKTIGLSDFVGKPLVINSWAAWCPFCRQELPDFAVVQKEFGDRVVIIAVDRAESLGTSKKYSDELGVTDDLIFLLDPSDSFYKSIGGFSMPETIFVNKDGNIVEHKRGPMDINEIIQKIQKIL